MSRGSPLRLLRAHRTTHRRRLKRRTLKSERQPPQRHLNINNGNKCLNTMALVAAAPAVATATPDTAVAETPAKTTKRLQTDQQRTKRRPLLKAHKLNGSANSQQTQKTHERIDVSMKSRMILTLIQNKNPIFGCNLKYFYLHRKCHMAIVARYLISCKIRCPR